MRVENKIVPIGDDTNEELSFPPCTPDEDSFALAVVECGGNIRAAYALAFGGDEAFPVAKGNQIVRRPQVALRIKALADAISESSLITLSSHLGELADIRDLAKMSGQLKTALAAEISRGNAVGIYKQHEQNTAPVAVQVNFVNQYDHTV